MNKSQLVDVLSDRLGDRRTAATAVDALLQIVVDTVRSGDSVSIAGFGVFESRARAARTGRNPRTGETVHVPATTVPAFRPGTGFRSAVAGDEAPAPPPAAPAAGGGGGSGRRRRSTTNGAGGQAAGAVLTSAVELDAPVTAAPDEDVKPAKGKKKGKAAKSAAKGAAKDAADGKGKKKGKKGK